jgi:hypothetical protein
MPVCVCSAACTGDEGVGDASGAESRGAGRSARLVTPTTPTKVSEIRIKPIRNIVEEESLCGVIPYVIYSRGMRASTWKAPNGCDA